MHLKIEDYLEQFRGDPPALKPWGRWADEYWEGLDKLSAVERTRLMEGDWNIAPGDRINFAKHYVDMVADGKYKIGFMGVLPDHVDRDNEYLSREALRKLELQWLEAQSPPPPYDGEIISAEPDDQQIQVLGDNKALGSYTIWDEIKPFTTTDWDNLRRHLDLDDYENNDEEGNEEQ